MRLEDLSNKELQLILYILNTDMKIINFSEKQKEILTKIYLEIDELTVGEIETINSKKYIAICEEDRENNIVKYDSVYLECLSYITENIDKEDVLEELKDEPPYYISDFRKTGEYIQSLYIDGLLENTYSIADDSNKHGENLYYPTGEEDDPEDQKTKSTKSEIRNSFNGINDEGENVDEFFKEEENNLDKIINKSEGE